MSRVLVVGWELPEQAPDERMEAANYRTWQLLEALRRDEHEVCLVAERIGAASRVDPTALVERRLTCMPMNFSHPSWIRKLQRLHDTFRPDCLLGVTFLGALRATRIRTRAPLWLDIYGDQMAEMQAGAHRAQSDRGIATQFRFLRQVLLAGDVFSTCSAPQRHALLGQLGMVGRLNRATFGYEFAHVVPPGAGQAPTQGTRGSLHRGSALDAGRRVVLWCGGYNTWTDVDTLYRGLERAMERDDRLHFLSVGGPAAGSTAYARFSDLVRTSRYAERFRLLGWQPVSRVPHYYRDADIGISLDAACYEAELGTRTRLVEMMQHGLPVVTTLACELSHVVRNEGLGLTFPPGDWRAMGEQILDLSRDDPRRRAMSERARTYAMTELSVENSTTPLRAWAQNPQQAPDRHTDSGSQVYSVEHSTRALVRQAIWAVAGLDR